MRSGTSVSSGSGAKDLESGRGLESTTKLDIQEADGRK